MNNTPLMADDIQLMRNDEHTLYCRCMGFDDNGYISMFEKTWGMSIKVLDWGSRKNLPIKGVALKKEAILALGEFANNLLMEVLEEEREELKNEKSI